MGVFSEFDVFLQSEFEGQTTTLRQIDEKIEEGGPDTHYYKILKYMILERGDPDLDREWVVNPDLGIETPEESKMRKVKNPKLEENDA